MSFRIRNDGLPDARFGSRAGSRSGGGCFALLLLIPLLALGFVMLLVGPVFILLPWAYVELRQARRRMPPDGFHLTSDVREKLAQLAAMTVDLHHREEETDSAAVAAGLKRTKDRHFDRRNPTGRKIELLKSALSRQFLEARTVEDTLYAGLTNEYTAWAEYIPRAWALRSVVISWLVLSMATSGTSLLAWWVAWIKVGSAAFTTSTLLAQPLPIGVVGIVAAAVGYIIGARIVTAQRPPELAGRRFLVAGDAARVVVPAFVVTGCLCLAGLWAFGRHVTEPLPTPANTGGPELISDPVPAHASAETDCGSGDHDPKGRKLAAAWSTFRCTAQQAAGSRWPACLQRSEYAPVGGVGCPGSELCCPPAAPSASAAAPAAPSVPGSMP